MIHFDVLTEKDKSDVGHILYSHQIHSVGPNTVFVMWKDRKISYYYNTQHFVQKMWKHVKDLKPTLPERIQMSIEDTNYAFNDAHRTHDSTYLKVYELYSEKQIEHLEYVGCFDKGQWMDFNVNNIIRKYYKRDQGMSLTLIPMVTKAMIIPPFVMLGVGKELLIKRTTTDFNGVGYFIENGDISVVNPDLEYVIPEIGGEPTWYRTMHENTQYGVESFTQIDKGE